MTTGFVPTLFSPRARLVERRADGSLLLRSTRPRIGYAGQLSEHLRRWATSTPDRTFLAERGPRRGAELAGWRSTSYGAARVLVDSYSEALLAADHTPLRPIAALVGNSVSHALLMLATMQVGIPFVSVSAAYSTTGGAFTRLRNVLAVTRPSALYVGRASTLAPALAQLELHGVQIIVDRAADSEPEVAVHAELATRSGRAVATLDDLARVRAGGALEEAYARVGPHSVAKVLMTSGSTGAPKGVVITQRTLAANGAGVDAAWPFLATHPPVLVDWLPLSHTFATNFNLPQIMRHGGSLYFDEGRPAPGLHDITLANLRDVKPTLLYNVPRGFDLLATALEADEELARSVLGSVDLVFYAGAHLPPSLWARLDALALRVRGAKIPLSTSLGSTETGPVATLRHWNGDAGDGVGDPIAGTELKVVPRDGKLELRVRGDSVSPGYFNDPAASAKAFDEEGFFLLGDAVRFVDDDPEKGILYDGRLAENFKLSTGNWVHVGELRGRILEALGGLGLDIVVAGHNRDHIAILVFPNIVSCAAQLGCTRSASEWARDPQLLAIIRERLLAHNAAHGKPSFVVRRAAVVPDAPSLEAGEITDKGYLSQRAALTHREELVALLFDESPESPADHVVEM